MADNIENPLLPESTSADDILGLYSPSELNQYKKLGMLDSRGIPTLPPGTPFNSQGKPYSPTMNAMSPEEKQSAATSDALAKAGQLWKQSENPLQAALPDTTSSGSNSLSTNYANRQLSLSEMTSLAKQAGFDDKTAPLMAAIAMGESQGWTNAHNPKHPDDSYGITQINRLAHGDVAKEAYNNPLRAMELAYKISNGGSNFRPWTVYTSGEYKKYLGGNGGGMVVSGNGGNTGLAGKLNEGPLTLPSDGMKVESKSSSSNGPSLDPAVADSAGISPLALLSLIGRYKITPVNYDPWKYVPKVEIPKI
ncbi:MAG TPA: hypothetical protein VJQ25_05950 [Nitrospira sp.]|nr:hypothetical protein [Nitrospira sp.]